MVIREEFVNYDSIHFTPLNAGRGCKTNGIKLVAEICSFDIEATRFEDVEQSIMYIWQFSIDNKIVIIGRTWQQFLHMLKKLKERLKGRYAMVYTHNLSYEFQFLAGVYSFTNREVFALEGRKILKCTMYDSFEFRCSYKLFNMSLEAVTRKFSCMYSKRSGEEFDYDKKRVHSSPLTRKELLYCVYDVMGLVEAIKKQLELFDDTLYTIPYTQTGYVRRTAKLYMREHHHEIQDAFPDIELFKTLRQAFRGGDTHASRYYAGEIIKNVHGNDVSSEYPAQQVLEKYPRGKFKKVGEASLTTKYIEKLMERGNAILMIVDIFDFELRTFYDGFPYITESKAIGKVMQAELDNGRVLAAKHIRLALTDIDYRIIAEQYKIRRLDVVSAWHTVYGPMYDGIIKLNKELFISKTELKGVAGQELYYAKAKEQLNAVYGMTCQNPLTPDVLFDFFRYTKSVKPDEEMIEWRKKGAFLTYQMGVWTTAHARAELRRFINRAGERAIYCDTDSLMYVGEVDFSDINAEYIYSCEKEGYGAYADDPSGKRHYMGVFECEDDPKAGYKFERFITLGAKRYAYEKPGGDLGITVAGVSKKSGAAELKRKGGLEAFAPGAVWEDSGKLEAVYNDAEYPELYEYAGELLHFTPNVTLRPTTYRIKFNDYFDLIRRCSIEDIERSYKDFLEMKGE